MKFAPIAAIVAVVLAAGSVSAAETQTQAAQQQPAAKAGAVKQAEYPSVPSKYLRPQKTEAGKQKADAAVEQLAQNVKKRMKKRPRRSNPNRSLDWLPRLSDRFRSMPNP